jgi:hypothetical protein
VFKFNVPSRVFAAALVAAVLGAGANAQQSRRDEQDAALNATRRGSVHSLRQIEGAVVPAMKRRGANYIGAEFDSDVMRYRLKFVRGSSVIWIDVDGRSGAIIAQAGN